MKILITIFLLAFVVFSNNNLTTLSNLLRFDGIYQSAAKASGTLTYRNHLRFYADDTVISSAIVSETGDIQNILSWFNKERIKSDSQLSYGTYFTNNDSIFFTTKSANGSVDYKGIITLDSLILFTHSNINGFESMETYYFKRIQNTSLSITNMTEISNVSLECVSQNTFTIKYTLKVNSPVDLKVYNMLGRPIISLINKRQSPGDYYINFNKKDLISGIYFIILNVNGNKKALKLNYNSSKFK